MLVAHREADEAAPTGTLVLAESQTAGRGRKGRTFQSNEQGGLYFTLLLRLPVEQHRRLPIVAPLAVARACEELGVEARIKWPNDIWVGERKLSGMLIDAQVDAGEPVALVGIGLNVNNDPTAIPELRDLATSLRRELGRPVEREPLLAAICNVFEELLVMSVEGLTPAYHAHSMIIGREITVAQPSGEFFEAVAVGLTAHGELRVRRASGGDEEVLSAAEVSVRPR